MRRVDIFVRDRNVRVKYQVNNLEKEYEWEDNYNLSQNFLLYLDKINNCNKNNINCLFFQRSDSAPTTIVLHQEGRESTTYRIILTSLRALAWASAVKLVTKP